MQTPHSGVVLGESARPTVTRTSGLLSRRRPFSRFFFEKTDRETGSGLRFWNDTIMFLRARSSRVSWRASSAQTLIVHTREPRVEPFYDTDSSNIDETRDRLQLPRLGGGAADSSRDADALARPRSPVYSLLNFSMYRSKCLGVE